MIIIRAKLKEQKRTYRDIVIDKTKSLTKLAEAVTGAFGFMFDHCYGFFSSPDIYGRGKDAVHYELFYDIDEETDELTESVEQTQIDHLFTQPKDKWWMLFDYGDDWVFELVYQQEPPELYAKQPHGMVINSKGDAPKQYQD